jgi:hypothetical protein
MKMYKEIIEKLKQVDADYYKGVYTTGEYFDLLKSISDKLKNY